MQQHNLGLGRCSAPHANSKATALHTHPLLYTSPASSCHRLLDRLSCIPSCAVALTHRRSVWRSCLHKHKQLSARSPSAQGIHVHANKSRVVARVTDDSAEGSSESSLQHQPSAHVGWRVENGDVGVLPPDEDLEDTFDEGTLVEDAHFAAAPGPDPNSEFWGPQVAADSTELSEDDIEQLRKNLLEDINKGNLLSDQELRASLEQQLGSLPFRDISHDIEVETINVDKDKYTPRPPKPKLLSDKEFARFEAELARQAQERKDAEEAQRKSAERPADAISEVDRDQYQIYYMDGYELLIAESFENVFDLSDMYIYQNGYYVRPKVDPGARVPRRPTAFQVMPWTESQSKDTLKRKPGYMKVLKLYFVGIKSTEPYRLQLNYVFCFDGSTRTLSQPPVRVVGRVLDPVLRIREDGITIEESGLIPSPFHVAMGELTPLEQLDKDRERMERHMALMAELAAEPDYVEGLQEAPDVPPEDLL